MANKSKSQDDAYLKLNSRDHALLIPHQVHWRTIARPTVGEFENPIKRLNHAGYSLNPQGIQPVRDHRVRRRNVAPLKGDPSLHFVFTRRTVEKGDRFVIPLVPPQLFADFDRPLVATPIAA